MSNRVERLIIYSFLLLYFIAASSVSLNRYWQYDAFWYDYGILDETIWRWSRFELPVIPSLAPPEGKLVWSDHFNPTLILLAPLYWLTDQAEMTLIAQIASAVGAALIAYQISRKYVVSSLVRMALVFSFLGFVGMQNALYTDIHNVVFALVPITFTLWAIFEKRWKWYWVGVITTLGVQENMALVVLGLGLYLFFSSKTRKIGLLTMCIAVVYGLIVMRLIIPYLNGGAYKYQPDIPVVWYEWFTRFFSADLKTPTIFYTFFTFGGWPLLSIATYPLVIFHFLERFVLNSAATRWDLGFHYNALLSPIMFLGSLTTIIWLQKTRWKNWLPAWGGLTLITVFVLHRFVLHGPLMLATHPVFYEQTKRNTFITDFVTQIPTDGLLMTQNNLAAHFTHKKVTLLNLNIEYIKPDVVALDMRPGQNANNFHPLRYDEAKSLVASLSASSSYFANHVSDSELIFIRK